MFRRRPKAPPITPEQALSARPFTLSGATLAEDADGGGRLVVPLKPGRVGGWLFRLPAGSTKTFELDAIGVFVWRSIDGRTSVRDLIRALADRHRLTLREAEVPTLAFLKTLIAKGLIAMPVAADPGRKAVAATQKRLANKHKRRAKR